MTPRSLAHALTGVSFPGVFRAVLSSCRRQKHCDHAGRMIAVAIQQGAAALIDIQYPMPA